LRFFANSSIYNRKFPNVQYPIGFCEVSALSSRKLIFKLSKLNY
jgi:hypothetical protein